MRTLTPAQRLIVAADYKPTSVGGYKEVRARVVALAEKLHSTGVTLKINSVLRACGYELIKELHDIGVAVFADLKLFDIGETLATDGALLREFRPELLTVVCVAGAAAMTSLKRELPQTEVLGVTVLTSMTEDECERIYSRSVDSAVHQLVRLARQAEIDGLIMSPAEARFIRDSGVEISINTPGIRPSWAIVPGDDQNPDRIMTPARAIGQGVDRIIVGRPILNHASPYDAVMRTIEEITNATI